MFTKTLLLAAVLTPLCLTPALAGTTAHTVNVALQGASSTTPGTVAANEKININQASAEQLARMLRGVGLARAQAIIELREKLGGFKDIEDLLQVRGLGVKVLEDNKDKIEL